MTTINQAMSKDIVETAKSIGEFKMLMQTVEAAGLTDTLRHQGPFTVFAPTDEAFRNLPTGMLEGWMRDLPKLKNILNYHIVDRKINFAEVLVMSLEGRTPEVKTVQGSVLVIKTSFTAQRWRDSKENVYVNDAQIIKTDVETSNGVIHVIDRVLLPPPMEKVYQDVNLNR
ncbi:MAG: fasciclin domain-containing protein [Nitrososphaerales archaeon]